MYEEPLTLERNFGEFGGRYVPEMLVTPLEELENAFNTHCNTEEFRSELAELHKNYSGRPTPLYLAKNLSAQTGSKTYLKLESHNHTGAHKINNVLGQILLAARMGKKEIVAETGAGQHGLATATAAAKFGMKCTVFMGETDIRRQYPNVYAMKLLGAEVRPVKTGSGTLKDAVNAALKYWIENLDSAHYLLGSAVGPHPYPSMVRNFQTVIGIEVKEQIMEAEGRMPERIIACAGGGSNALGIFTPFLKEEAVELVAVEAGGTGRARGQNAVRMNSHGREGIVQGYRSYFILDDDGQVMPTHSVSAGLDYAGISPELAALSAAGRVKFEESSDGEALEAYATLARLEGIIPALESAHAVAYALKAKPGAITVINISGRGDKDIFIAARELDRENWTSFLEREVLR